LSVGCLPEPSRAGQRRRDYRRRVIQARHADIGAHYGASEQPDGLRHRRRRSDAPAEIMTVAAALLAEFAPGVQPPESVRAWGVQPWSRRVAEDELPTAIEEFVRDEAGREGTAS
jgi:hypothetical protein